MGFIAPTPPPFDVEDWEKLPHLERIRLLAQDWAQSGLGSPVAVYLAYLVKLVVYAGGGLLVISATTAGLGGIGDAGDWWTEPIVFQKAVVWTMLWEILGLGAGSLPLTLRFRPPIGGILYWLRPGTTRLPPWPGKVPLTAGSTRTLIDVVLYAAVLGVLVGLLLGNGVGPEGLAAGRLDATTVAVLLGLLGLLGLRDKVPFLAARAEVYGTLMLPFLFAPENWIVAWQVIFFCIWWGAAASKLNRHFPFVVTVMISNTPWNRWKGFKRSLYRDHPDDLLPSWRGAMAAHIGTVMEFTLPLVLLLSQGGPIGTLAMAGMVIFHLHILSTFPLAVPLEWNIFMIFGLFFLFGHYGDVPLSTLDDPLLIGILLVTCVGLPVLGNFRPDLVSFLPAMRYYAGNWATSVWLFRKEGGAERKIEDSVVKSAPLVVDQLTDFYDRQTAELMMYKGLAFRAMHSHGRGLNGLLPRAVDDVEAYSVREGELVAGVVLGYNFGDGHFHDEALLAAVQERCRFEPGELRVVMLESQPAHLATQRYRIHDAATGLIESGTVDVIEMVTRQPWLGPEPFPASPDPPPGGPEERGGDPARAEPARPAAP